MAGPQRRVAVVTGGSSGIGLAVGSMLLDAGFNLAFFGRSEEHVEHARHVLSRRHYAGRIMATRVDLASPDEISGFFRAVSERWRPADTLICNAGISPKRTTGDATPFCELNLDEWNRVLAVNLTGAMLCCQAVLAPMIASRFGRIILVGSIAGRAVPRLAGTSYAVSKAALGGLCRSLIADCAGSGVTVNVIAPGHIVTGMTAPVTGDGLLAVLSRIPAGRLGEVDDVAALAGFLVSREAGFVNGAVIDVNGGEYAPL